MKRLLTALLVAMLALSGAGDALAKKRNNTARNIAIGVAAAAATIILLNEASKSKSSKSRVGCPSGAPYWYGGACHKYRDCPGDSIRNSKGKCVKEDEPSESNATIIRKCNYYLSKCQNGFKWACPKAADYCDRG